MCCGCRARRGGSSDASWHRGKVPATEHDDNGRRSDKHRLSNGAHSLWRAPHCALRPKGNMGEYPCRMLGAMRVCQGNNFQQVDHYVPGNAIAGESA
jgi:hypothetical protein